MDIGLVASYNSLLIAKSWLPFTVGEKLVLPAIRETISTVIYNALLMAYVRYVSGNGVAMEFLFGKYLTTGARRQTIFNAPEEYQQENSVPIVNILACATDGAPFMVGRFSASPFCWKSVHLMSLQFTVFCTVTTWWPKTSALHSTNLWILSSELSPKSRPRLMRWMTGFLGSCAARTTRP